MKDIQDWRVFLCI